MLDAQAGMFILNTISKKNKQHLISCTSAYDMCTNMSETFKRNDEQQKGILLQEFYTQKWDPTKSAMDNISVTQNLAHHLAGLNRTLVLKSWSCQKLFKCCQVCMKIYLVLGNQCQILTGLFQLCALDFKWRKLSIITKTVKNPHLPWS